MKNRISGLARSTCLVLACVMLCKNAVVCFETGSKGARKSSAWSRQSGWFPLCVGNGSTDATFPPFSSESEYISYLSSACALPSGFSIGTGSGKFISREAPELGPLPIRLTVIYLSAPTTAWAASFTQNAFPGAPILVGRERLARKSALQCMVINNKVSNVCTATGVADAERVCSAAASLLDLSGGEAVLPSSTGVIGWTLPAEELAEEVLPLAVKELRWDSALPMAKAIMTTDRYPKLRSKTLSSGARIVGVAKGAGMIEPNMATMLCFFLTDAQLDANLQNLLQHSIHNSFNCISVDSDESTSDTAVLVSSNRISSDPHEFQIALDEISKGLAQDVVRNGEGTSHVIKVTVRNYAPSFDAQTAKAMAKNIVNSPLFKCAVAGNDPNVGRLASAIGSFLGKSFPHASHHLAAIKKGITVTMGDILIFSHGTFNLNPHKERLLSQYMKDASFGELDTFPAHQNTVHIAVDFGLDGGQEVVVYGSDLTHEYVTVNADYRS